MTKIDGLELAVLFHVIYERKSAEFNYITRVDTRVFDPESPNGKLMMATCEEILSDDILPKIESLETSRDAWKKLAEELGKEMIERLTGECRCKACLCYAEKEADIPHTSDCPIEQLRDLQRSEG